MKVAFQEREVSHQDFLSTKSFLAKTYPSKLHPILFLSNLLTSQLGMKSHFLCKENNAKQLNNANQVIKVKQLTKHKLKIANYKALYQTIPKVRLLDTWSH